MKKQISKVSDVIAGKGNSVSTIKPTDTIATLSQRLRDEKIGALIVSKDGKSVDGIISERDIAYALSKHLGDLHRLPVSDLMTKSVVTCSPDDSVDEIAVVLRDRRIRHMPVTDGKKVFGVIAMRDILSHRLDAVRLSARKAGTLVRETA